MPRDMRSLLPYAVREFANPDLEWLIHRQLFKSRIDVLQLEYTPMAQYRGAFRRIATALFEHDVYFQSIGRGFGHHDRARSAKSRRASNTCARCATSCARCRASIRCRSARRRIATICCSFRPDLASKLRAGLRAGIDTSRYEFRPTGREPLTMLFLGSFRHDPNRVAVDWFVREVLPLILRREPRARLVIAGSDPPPAHAYADYAANLDMLGYVDDCREPLAQYAVFVCRFLADRECA